MLFPFSVLCPAANRVRKVVHIDEDELPMRVELIAKPPQPERSGGGCYPLFHGEDDVCHVHVQ